MIKQLSLPTLLALGLVFSAVIGQSIVQAANSQNDDEPLHVVINYADGTKKVRESHHGSIDPIALPVAQQITITLQFPNKRAGAPVFLSSLDGGDLTLPSSTSVSSNGDFTFQFHAGNLPGVFRLLINSLQQYQVSLYAYDPSHPPGHGHNGASRQNGANR